VNWLGLSGMGGHWQSKSAEKFAKKRRVELQRKRNSPRREPIIKTARKLRSAQEEGGKQEWGGGDHVKKMTRGEPNWKSVMEKDKEKGP